MSKREIWINPIFEKDGNPGVDYRMGVVAVKDLHAMLSENASAPVRIHLYTAGGDWDDGMAIYDTVQGMPYEVTMIAYGSAESMASIVFQAADVRYLMPNCHLMLHMGSLHVSGEATAAASTMKFFEANDAAMVDLYAARMKRGKKFKGMTLARIRRFLRGEFGNKGDVYLSPQEAIEWGLADGIVTAFNADGSLEVSR